ncbi:MAG: alkaline phosphatase D family protein [Myxococcota bacterium]
MKSRYKMLVCWTAATCLLAACSTDESGPEAQGPDVVNCEVDVQADQAVEVAFDPTSVPEAADLFPLGVQAGAMTSDRVVVWSVASDGAPKTLRVWREGTEPGRVALVEDRQVEGTEGYLKVAVEGLSPRTTYWYAYFEGSEGAWTGRSRVGRFVTAFPDGCLAPLTIGGTHGTKYTRSPFTALDITAEYEPDVYVHLGDISYNDKAAKVGTPAAYRGEWRKTFEVPGFQEINAATGQYVVWDDHEVVDNSSLYDLEESVTEVGKQSFFEHTPMERLDNGSYWRSYRWGRTAEFFALDCRHERDQESAFTDDATYIGEDQMEWLKKGLLESPSFFKVILNSVPISQYPPLVAFQEDRWQGFERQREEILSFIEEHAIERVVWLTGDFHLGTVNRIEREGPRSRMWEIMMGPGGNKDNPMWNLVQMCVLDREDVAPADQFPFFGGQYMATFVELNPVRDTVRVQFVDADTRELLYDATMKAGGDFSSAPLPGEVTCEP